MTKITAKKVLLKDENGNALIPYTEQTNYIGQILSMNCSPSYVPEGTLPCDGAEYTKAQFNDLWNNWLTSEDCTIVEEGWQTLTAGSNNLHSVVYANGKYVAVGDSGVILTSDDGVTWSSQTVGTNRWGSITYGNGKFVVVNSYCEVTTSTDGVTWSDVITIDNNDDYLYSVAYGNGTFVAVGAYGCVVTSTDGVNWTTPIYVGEDLWNDVTYGNGKFVAIGDLTVSTSTDGVNWTEPITLETKYHYSVTYGKGKFVATGSYGNIMTSEDGLNWTKCDVVADVTWTSVTYAKAKFVAVGSQGYITTSEDGITWTEPVVMGNNAWSSVACSDDKLIVVGYSGNVVYNSFEIKYNGLLNTCTYTEYQQEFDTYGQCAKFAVDIDNETFRVPLIKDGTVIQQALSDSELGKAYNAGLPNITGTISSGSYSPNATGAFYDAGGSCSSSPNSGASTSLITFDASLSNAIYGNSDTVQMNAVALRYFVVVANGQINQSIMDWSAWGSSLQGKANIDFSNVDKLSLLGLRKLIEVSDSSLIPSWYKVFEEIQPDGSIKKWCEQGSTNNTGSELDGTQTVTFMKEFLDTNYLILKMNCSNGTGTPSSRASTFYNKTTTTAQTYLIHKGGGWVAKGYIN